jgi:hypothetical protein
MLLMYACAKPNQQQPAIAGCGKDQGMRDSARKTLQITDEKHGLRRLKTAVKQLGGRVIDRRTSLGKGLAEFRSALIQDLGGTDSISTQQKTLVDMLVKSKLLLDSIDAWLLSQPTLVNARRRALLPVVRERAQLCDSICRMLVHLGFERRTRKIADLPAYLAQRYGGIEQHGPNGTASTPGADQ